MGSSGQSGKVPPGRKRFSFGLRLLIGAWGGVLLGFGAIAGWLWWADAQAPGTKTAQMTQQAPLGVAARAAGSVRDDGGEQAAGAADEAPTAPPAAAEGAAEADAENNSENSAPTDDAATAPGASEDSTQAADSTAGQAETEAPDTDSGTAAAPKIENFAQLELKPAPDPALIVETEKGPLPVIGDDGRLPWQVYARPSAAPPTASRIAIIMADLGLSASATRTTIQQLPGGITLAFAPYATNLQDWISQARAAGHEVMLQLPMEPYNYPANDPGPNALLTTLSTAANLERLEWLLGRFVGYVGVINYMGSRFTASVNDIEPVMKSLKARGLLFVDARASSRSAAARAAAQIGVPQAYNNRFLDNEAARASIDERLRELEEIARSTGTAVGLGYPYPVTIERIAKWAPGLAEKGIWLVPVSAVVNRQRPVSE